MAHPTPELDLIEVPSCSIFVGNTATGKTHAFRWLFSKICDKFDYGIVISSTCRVNDDYDFIPKKYLHDTFDHTIIEQLEAESKRHAEKRKRRPTHKVPNVFIIIDDIIGTIDFRTSEGRIFDNVSKWRHINISTFFIVQHFTYLPPVVRGSARQVFVTKVNDKNIASLYETCACGFSGKVAFKQYLDDNCRDYNLICFNPCAGYSGELATIVKPPAERVQFKLAY
jgi:hypothetical protein